MSLSFTMMPSVSAYFQKPHVAVATLVISASVTLVTSLFFACTFIIPKPKHPKISFELSHSIMAFIAATSVAIAVNLLLSRSLGLPLSLKSVVGISAAASGGILAFSYKMWG